MATNTEILVLTKIYEIGNLSRPVHYSCLIPVIYSEETLRMYRPRKLSQMACSYLGKMAHKDYIHKIYEGDSFVGYKLRPLGRKLIGIDI